MSVNLTPQKSAVSRQCVGKTDVFKGKELAVAEKTGFLAAVWDRYLIGGEPARAVARDYERRGTHDVYHYASLYRRRFHPNEPPRQTVQEFNRGGRLDTALMWELLCNGASEAEVAAFFATNIAAVRDAKRGSRP